MACITKQTILEWFRLARNKHLSMQKTLTSTMAHLIFPLQNKYLKLDDSWSDLSPDKVCDNDKMKKEHIGDIMNSDVRR